MSFNGGIDCGNRWRKKKWGGEGFIPHVWSRQFQMFGADNVSIPVRLQFIPV